MYNGDLKIELKSDLSRISKKDTEINLVSNFSTDQIYTKNWHFLLDRDEFFTKSFTKQIAEIFDDLFLDTVLDCEEDFLDLVNIPHLDTFEFLYQYLSKNGFDFVIMSPLRSSGFITELRDPKSDEFINDNTINVSKIKYWGILNRKFEFFVNHSWDMDNDLLICGKSESIKYNFRINSCEYKEKEIDVISKINFDLDFELNLLDFKKLYLVSMKSKKYLNYFRKSLIDKLL